MFELVAVKACVVVVGLALCPFSLDEVLAIHIVLDTHAKAFAAEVACADAAFVAA